MGDVAGIGPEIIARAWPRLLACCQPVVIGDPDWLRQGLRVTKQSTEVSVIRHPQEADVTTSRIAVIPASDVDLLPVKTGHVSAAAGKAAYDYLCRAIDWTMERQADAIVTCPLHKEGLHQAGVAHPGHTEILAERTGTQNFAMMLHARCPQLPNGLTVLHVTLHCGLREVFAQLSTDAIAEKIELLHGFLLRLLGRPPGLMVAGLNPHAGDGGLFGDEEARIIAPAIRSARDCGRIVSGPWPSDTLFVRARAGDCDGIVAMYHDQGHIPMKLLAGWHAVNVSVGLPIVRTSVAHGTAYDIAGTGQADPVSLIEAVRLAAEIVQNGSW